MSASKADQIREWVKTGAVDTVLAVVPDMIGRLMGKRITGRFFVDDVLGSGIHACAYLLTVDMEMEPLPGFSSASWGSGYGDFKALPDMSTLRLIPWLEKTALVVCDLVSEHGEPIEISPRQILKRQIARAQKLGYRYKTASELEFYLYKDSYETARGKNFHELLPISGYLEDYHILQTSREEFVIQAIRNGMEAAGVPVEGSKGEWGKGQEEINLRYTDALEMADRHVIYKNGVKEIASQKGVSITFMAKPFEGQAGSSFHLHSSLWDAEGNKPLFSKGYNDSLFRRHVGGHLALGPAMAFWFAPTINSYKRYQSGTFAPTRLVWGIDNRTCGLRALGEGASTRLENRMPGADANPYLAFAMTLAASLHGIEKQLTAPDPFAGNAYESSDVPQMPKTLRDALDVFEKSQALREIFGDVVIDHYAHAGRLEQAAFDQTVTCWERARYFERI